MSKNQMKINVACPDCNFYVPLTMPIEGHTSYGQCACGIKVEVRFEVTVNDNPHCKARFEKLFVDFEDE